MGRQGMVVGEELPPLSRQMVSHRYIFKHENFQLVCTHVFEEKKLVEVVRKQSSGRNIFRAMQKDKRVERALIHWVSMLERIQEKHGWND